MKFCLNYKRLKVWAFLYLSLPLLLFVCGFTRLLVAIPCCLAIVFAVWQALCKAKVATGHETEIVLSKTTLIALILFVLLWSFLGGLNGFWYQSSDWPWRNAIYHDLIDYSWPVVYPENDSALVYYIGFWLPPALVAKGAAILGASADIVWLVARFALWLWSCLGLLLVLLLLWVYVKADTQRKKVIVCLVFIFFSGLDIIGALYTNKLPALLDPGTLHLEWWTQSANQYSSITTCLYWVFNQAIVPWLAVMCFLFEKDARNYLFLGMACMCCGPLPFVGLVLCMVGRWGQQFFHAVRNGRIKEQLWHTFSVANLLLLLTVFPVLGCYFLANGSVQNTVAGAQTLPNASLSEHLVFYILEAGVYLLLLWHRHKKDVLFYLVAASLFFIPYVHVGVSADFCMRASIPGIFILMVWCAGELTLSFSIVNAKVRALIFLLTIAFILGAATPAMEIYRGCYNSIIRRITQQDDFQTLTNLSSASNFVLPHNRESIFIQYLTNK